MALFVNLLSTKRLKCYSSIVEKARTTVITCTFHSTPQLSIHSYSTLFSLALHSSLTLTSLFFLLTTLFFHSQSTVLSLSLYSSFTRSPLIHSSLFFRFKYSLLHSHIHCFFRSHFTLHSFLLYSSSTLTPLLHLHSTLLLLTPLFFHSHSSLLSLAPPMFFSLNDLDLNFQGQNFQWTILTSIDWKNTTITIAIRL